MHVSILKVISNVECWETWVVIYILMATCFTVAWRCRSKHWNRTHSPPHLSGHYTLSAMAAIQLC